MALAWPGLYLLTARPGQYSSGAAPLEHRGLLGLHRSNQHICKVVSYTDPVARVSRFTQTGVVKAPGDAGTKRCAA